MFTISTIGLVLSSLTLGVVGLKWQLQKNLDHERSTYQLTFPNDLVEDRLLAWLYAISGTLQSGRSRIIGVPTIVFETWATDRGITHRVSIPWQQANYIVGQLRTHIPGVHVEPDESRPQLSWNHVIEVGMKRPERTLRIPNSKDVSASLLASVQALGPGETVMTQWVIAQTAVTTLPTPPTSTGKKPSMFTAITGIGRSPSSDSINDERAKLQEPNFLAIGRVAAQAETPPRARHLADQVMKSLASTRSPGTRFTEERAFTNPTIRANDASSPTFFPAQLTINELAAVVAWPIGQPFVAGLPQGSTRHLHATEDIARVGRVLGHSNYPGHERPIAVDYLYAGQHTYVGGATGTGKTVLMANSIAQDMANGYGAIVIDAGNSDSNETLFSRALSYVPRTRLDDVIILDVNKSRNRPVGFNILDQGNPRIVVDQIADLFAHLYQDTNGVWTRELLFHGLYTLAERPGMTFVDLTTFLTPRTRDEVAWSDEIRRGVKDPELRMFWQRWENFGASERDRYTQPLMNRAWQLISRPETRNIIGQSASSFKMTDVIKGNKILLVSLAGLPTETASLLGTLLVNALWTAAQTMTPEKANFLYLDEFQLMTRLPMGLDDMLARARKHKLGVTLGTQYLEDLPVELKNAVINNARTKVIFQSSAKEARTWQSEFGRQYVNESDFTHIRKYEAVAQIATASGIGAPITMAALAPFKSTGVESDAVRLSGEKYGRNIQDVERQMIERRMGQGTPTNRRPQIGIREWGE